MSLVTVGPCLPAKEENSFIRALIGKDRSAVRRVFQLESDHPGYLQCKCSSPAFFQSGTMSVEILMVLAHLGLINVEMLVASVITRRRAGRPSTTGKWSDTKGATTSRGASWYLNDINKNRPGKYFKWQVVVKKNGRNIVGKVGAPQDKGRGMYHWQVDFPGDGSPAASLDLSAEALAEALHQASELGFQGPAP